MVLLNDVFSLKLLGNKFAAFFGKTGPGEKKTKKTFPYITKTGRFSFCGSMISPKILDLPVGLIPQLVEHYTSISEVWVLIPFQVWIAVITVEPAGNTSFVYTCMQTRLKGQYNGKWPIRLVCVSKLLITVITAIFQAPFHSLLRMPK